MLFLLLKTLKMARFKYLNLNLDLNNGIKKNSRGACPRTRLEVLTHDLSIFWALRTPMSMCKRHEISPFLLQSIH